MTKIYRARHSGTEPVACGTQETRSGHNGTRIRWGVRLTNTAEYHVTTVILRDDTRVY